MTTTDTTKVLFAPSPSSLEDEVRMLRQALQDVVEELKLMRMTHLVIKPDPSYPFPTWEKPLYEVTC